MQLKCNICGVKCDSLRDMIDHLNDTHSWEIIHEIWWNYAKEMVENEKEV